MRCPFQIEPNPLCDSYCHFESSFGVDEPRDFEDPDALTILSEARNRNGARLLSLQIEFTM